MSDKLCKLVKKKNYEKNIDAYIELVKDGKFLCKKCGRIANKKSAICKVIKLDE